MQEPQLLDLLDALGDDLQIEAARQRHDRVDDCRTAFVVRQLGDERAIDFEDVDRQRHEMAQR